MQDRKIRNMEEFAAVAGISRPTVSKYFHDPESVKKSTRSRIEAALEEHDYRPNIFAMNQNRQLTKNVGIVVPYLADPYFAEIARTIERALIDAGFFPLLYSAHGEAGIEVEILDSLRALKPAGVLLAPLGRRSSNRAEIERFCDEVPTILFDSNIEGIGEAFVGSDNYSFVSQTVDYLVGEGMEPCFIEMTTPANPNAVRRHEAYLAKMEQYGLQPRVVGFDGQGWDFERIGREGMLRLIESGGPPTRAVLCSNDRLAIGVLAACYEKGLRVGRGDGTALCVASHDDHPFSRFTCPALTTSRHDYQAVAGGAVDTLLDLIAAGGRFDTRHETLFPTQFVKRASA